MNVLVIGGSGNIINTILEKLHKEGHRIFVLTGSTVRSYAYKHVYEQYSFSYESNSIKEIFESISPEVTIFMGAYDSNFDWTDPRRQSVRYSAGLLNILMGYSLAKCGRFIYLSSEMVFQNSYMEDITEDEPVVPNEFHSGIIAQGEDACRAYQGIEGNDIVIVRIEHLYALPANRSEMFNPVAGMFMEAFEKGEIAVNPNDRFSVLYISDAAEFLYQIISAKKLAHSCYHLGGDREINELYLAEKINNELGGGILFTDKPTGEKRRILSAKRFHEEFGGRILWSVNRVIPYMSEHIKRNHRPAGKSLHERLYSGDAVKGIKAAVPTIENVICFIIFFLIDNWAANNIFLKTINFDIAYVMIFAVFYGQRQATLSSILAAVGYCVRQMGERSGFDVAMDHTTFLWMASILTIAMVVGYLHDRLALERRERAQEEEFLKGQISDLRRINSRIVRVKNVLQEQVVNHGNSIGKIYEITSELDKFEPQQVLENAASVVARLLNCQDVAVYQTRNAYSAELASATSENAARLGKNISYRELGDMFMSFQEKKVFINRTLDENSPMFASGIYADEELRVIIMIWSVPFERMTLGTANHLKVTGYLIRNALLRAEYTDRQIRREIKVEPGK